MALTNETSATIVTTGCSGDIYGIDGRPRPSFESVFHFLVVFSRFSSFLQLWEGQATVWGRNALFEQ
jgi:hypothetical protein